MKKKILILSSSQFGYLTDTLKFCEYSKDEYRITYVGWDYNLPSIVMQGVEVKYVSRQGNLIARNLRLLQAFNDELKNHYDLVFTNYFRGISLIKILNRRKKFVFDIRTLSVDPNKGKRLAYNLILKIESLFFKNVTVISKGIANKLGLKSYRLLPLGGECFSTQIKMLNSIHLIYVGTLLNRNILDCVKGFHLYIKNTDKFENPILFTIIGDGPNGELNEIKSYIRNNHLESYFQTPGRVHNSKLNFYFDNATIGVSYIPIRSYFQFQPPTKTFEYLISGLPVLATNTFENKNIVKGNCGVLIDDNPQAFAEGLKKMVEGNISFDRDYIKKSFSSYSWKEIVMNNYHPIFNACISKG